MYLSQLRLHNIGHHTWVSDVLTILTNSNLTSLWDQGAPNSSIAKHIKKHMELLYRTFWIRAEIKDSTKNPKLRLYKHIKGEFGTELYLHINIPKFRSALSRLRLSSHHLEIETGRYKRPIVPAEKRFCTFCKDEAGDEIHFIASCKQHCTDRQKLFSDIANYIPDLTSLSHRDQYITLLTHDNIDVLVHLAKYINTAFKAKST
jgi:hypothetical protein